MDLIQAIHSVESPISPTFRLALVVGVLGVALILEWLYPLRRPTQPKQKRLLINLGLATISAAILRFSFYPVVMYMAFQTEAHQFGLLPAMGVSGTGALLLSIVLLDGTLFYWHWMLHKIPFLWRFHNVHHIDLDLDSSTAFRFHFGELALSTVFRSGQILVFGITPFNLALFELLITTFAQFHHGNFRLPLGVERLLARVTITPRLHGIHHSTVKSETDSNFGTIFSCWDYFHQTFKADVSQDEIVIGVPSYREPREQNLWHVLRMPFQRQRAWRYPNGTIPSRAEKTKGASYL